jgi:hypothetical protein
MTTTILPMQRGKERKKERKKERGKKERFVASTIPVI